MTNETQCGRIGFATVSDCAERAAGIVCHVKTPQAVCLSPDGFVTVEAVAHAIPDDIVGVYTARSSVELWLQISGDLFVSMQERGIRGSRANRHRVMGERRAA